ncbi:MAG: hypothetical protein ACI8PB_005341 [Desulforhopalus sp.]|jgi:hypothetical protein
MSPKRVSAGDKLRIFKKVRFLKSAFYEFIAIGCFTNNHHPGPVQEL